MEFLFDQIFEVADALKEGVAGLEEFLDIKTDFGYPADMRDLHFWVSIATTAEAKPIDSNLRLFENGLRVGGGITVAQVLVDGWLPVRQRLLELTRPFESFVRGDPTIGGTCARAYIGRTETAAALETETKGRMTAFWELTIVQYASG
jgi:hypothetical protein